MQHRHGLRMLETSSAWLSCCCCWRWCLCNSISEMVIRRLQLDKVSHYKHSSLRESSLSHRNWPPPCIRMHVCVWVSFLYQCYHYPPQLPDEPSNWVKNWKSSGSVLIPPSLFLLHIAFFIPFLLPTAPFLLNTCSLSRWSTPSCPLLRRCLPLRWWWLCRHQEHHLNLSPHVSDTCLWRERKSQNQS